MEAVTAVDRASIPRADAPAVRLVRSIGAALVCVATAAAGHWLAGGTLPAATVLAVFAGSSAVVWFLSVRRITPGQLVGLLALCQAGVHLTGSSHEMTSGMVLGHVAATAVSAAVLARGERFVWQLAERLGLRLAPQLRIGSSLVAARLATPIVTAGTRRDVRLTHSRALRGPPVAAA